MGRVARNVAAGIAGETAVVRPLRAGFRWWPPVVTLDVKQLLVDHGYGIYRWRDSAFGGVTVDEPHGHEDLFALKPHHLARMLRQ